MSGLMGRSEWEKREVRLGRGADCEMLAFVA